jgi:hypothetical protein
VVGGAQVYLGSTVALFVEAGVLRRVTYFSSDFGDMFDITLTQFLLTFGIAFVR